MKLSPRAAHGALRWVNTIVALVAIVAQLSGALAPLGEVRQGRSATPHVEQSGTSTHRAHSEESCAVCQARSVHATVSRTPALKEIQERASAPLARGPEQVVTAERFSLGSPRAPPSL
jgi:hypothetical protein